MGCLRRGCVGEIISDVVRTGAHRTHSGGGGGFGMCGDSFGRGEMDDIGRTRGSARWCVHGGMMMNRKKALVAAVLGVVMATGLRVGWAGDLTIDTATTITDPLVLGPA